MVNNEPLFQLPKHSILIFRLIEREGSQTQKDLAEKLNLSLRSLRYTLRRMELRGVISKKANLKDMRSLFYVIDEAVMSMGIDRFLIEEGLIEISS